MAKKNNEYEKLLLDFVDVEKRHKAETDPVKKVAIEKEAKELGEKIRGLNGHVKVHDMDPNQKSEVLNEKPKEKKKPWQRADRKNENK